MFSGMRSGSDLTQGNGALGPVTDIFIIGGGVNGCGIARDAAGRGLSVRLVEAGDLAQGTSSASTKLLHGGLRYLEYLDLSLVRASLREREVLLKMMPHIAHPLRFVFPLDPAMRFASDTPVSRIIGRLAPWLRGKRPAAIIRAGLFLYDHMGGRKILPPTRRLDLRQGAEGEALRPDLKKAYEYSDVWVDDARLVVLNARDAAQRGAEILTRAQVVEMRIQDGLWRIMLKDGRNFLARCLINAGGPWAGNLAQGMVEGMNESGLRLVRGSHIVTRRLYPHDKAYFLQGPDGRVVFILPYEDHFSLIGTTDAVHEADPADALCSEVERDYLLECANRYLRQEVGVDDIVWSFSGVRPLYDDGADSPSAVTRDYVLRLEDTAVPAISVLGGKLTNYRVLSEKTVDMAGEALQLSSHGWTKGVALPGGDFPVCGRADLVEKLEVDFPWLGFETATRMIRSYGTDAWILLRANADPGVDFGAGLHEVELEWMAQREWARSAQDALFRRSKLGLHMNSGERAAVQAWFDAKT